ncbi:uncharacterized protein LOC130408444 [Triplophysa dalaica]|uniref:uncharacterized protein LOC130408444 n=1 Tax=Triplophysa dalaica TaxID=1582913 RepID=UPI0024DFEA6C|nr:uncharacterized protein LOC130408444 [Triplophysa dalaica]
MSQSSNEDSALPGTSANVNPDEYDVHEQIQELSRKHAETVAAIAGLNREPSRSYIYVPRERHIQSFSGEFSKDGRNVDEFIEEVERVLLVRNQTPEDQADFVLSLLKGAALEEVRLRRGAQPQGTEDLFTYLRDAFGEKRSLAQLLQSFYTRKQLEGEDLRMYSHSLSQILNSVVKQSPDAIANVNSAIRDQFVEGVKDASLRRELRKFVRDKPQATLIEVRDEAIMWSLEDPKLRVSRAALHHHVTSESAEARCEAIEKSSVTLEEVLKVVAEQGKAIGELTQAIQKLTLHCTNAEVVSRPKAKMQPRFADDGQPICFKCNEVGHIAKNCVRKLKQTVREDSVSSTPQGNAHPRSL